VSELEQQTSPDVGPRDRILEASLKLFVEQGYFNTNVPDISKHTRCSVGSIYHHFLNKEEIASQLYLDGIEQFRRALTAALRPNDSLEQNIRSLVEAFLEFAEDHKLLSRYIWLARHHEFLSGSVSSPTTVGLDTLGRNLTKALKNGIRTKQIAPLEAEVIWSILFGIPLSFVRDWLDGYTRQTPKQVAPTIAKACWSALQGANGTSH